MILPKIMNIGVYREAQKSTQVSRTWTVSLYLKGRIRQSVYGPDGSHWKTIDTSVDEDVPTLALGIPGCRTVFEFDHTRENWVIMLAFPALTFDCSNRQIYLAYNGHYLPLPKVLPLKSAEAAELKRSFENICRLFHSSLPANLLQADLELLKILQRFLQQPVKEEDIVEHLRKRLEDDVLWKYSISEHCRRVGINRDLFRSKFAERYQVSPGDFRRDMRLKRILHLIVYTNLSLKEISNECGMKNLSHLSSFIKKSCGKTASALCREYRKNGSADMPKLR